MGEDETYTVPEAAKVLRLSERRVQQMLQLEELPGVKLDSGAWSIPRHAVHARKDETKRSPKKRAAAPPEEGRRVNELEDELRSLERLIGRLEGRLELTAVAESTLRESLERERERVDRTETEARRLREELEAERSKGFWKRLFGR